LATLSWQALWRLLLAACPRSNGFLTQWIVKKYMHKESKFFYLELLDIWTDHMAFGMVKLVSSTWTNLKLWISVPRSQHSIAQHLPPGVWVIHCQACRSVWPGSFSMLLSEREDERNERELCHEHDLFYMGTGLWA
jgi:hypothetical protein